MELFKKIFQIQMEMKFISKIILRIFLTESSIGQMNKIA